MMITKVIPGFYQLPISWLKKIISVALLSGRAGGSPELNFFIFRFYLLNDIIHFVI